MSLSDEIQDEIEVLCYTRFPQDEMIYAPRLAYSMHLAYKDRSGLFQALNDNSGILFAKATQNASGSLNAKSLKNPYLFNMADGKFGVIAVRTEADGGHDEESRGGVILFVSSDLLQYNEMGLLNLTQEGYVEDVSCRYDEGLQEYHITWCDEEGNYYRKRIADLLHPEEASDAEKAVPFTLEPVSSNIEGIRPRNCIRVLPEVARRLILKLTVPVNVRNEVPGPIPAVSEEDLQAVKVTAVYSDGTTTLKPVDWELDKVDWKKPGSYTITGTVHQDHYPFPIAVDRADPCITNWNGKYYFIATNDADHNHTLYIREAESIPDLVEAKEHLILDSETYEDIKGLLWAPEFHVIEGELYLFHGATSSEFYYEESHVMKLRTGGNPVVAEDWSRPTRVLKQNGSYLCEAGKTISLDMTVIKGADLRYYAVWSERQFLPEDLGARLYIAAIDPKEPWKLITDPVVLSKPEYGWANNHVFVDEGPYVLKNNGKLFLTFASALIDATYVVGLLVADQDADILNPASWTKVNYPLLTSRSVPGEFGPGHNSYVTDASGLIWNAYHARQGVEGPRSSGLRRVHFDIDGYPRLNLTEDKDLNPDLAKVKAEIIVNS